MADTYETTMMPDDGEKLSIPYGSLRPSTPAPVAQTPSQPQWTPQTPPPPVPTERK
jgi:hypothetical protein